MATASPAASVTLPVEGPSPSPQAELTAPPAIVSLQRAPGVWTPRPYQLGPESALAAGIRRLMAIWHRRAGKDVTALQFAKKRMDERPATYWHLFPRHVQARRAIWNGVDPDTGVRFIDQAFPIEERDYVNEPDMFIRMKNGATWQLFGSDWYDRIVGAPPAGVVFSEWAICDPRAWDFVRPILAENNGWAFFITTYRGRNHAYQMAQKLKNNPDWWVDVRDVLHTTRSDGSPVVTEASVQKDRDSGMSESLIRQEYYCDPMAAVPGAVYGSTMMRLLEQRAGHVLYDPSFPVHCAWNLDDMPSNVSRVFYQPMGNEFHVIGSRSSMFATLAEAIDEQELYPWAKRVRENLVRTEGASGLDYAELLEAHNLPTTIVPMNEARPALTAMRTQAILERTSVDTVPRDFAEDRSSNNALLVDSLNGYSLRELDPRNGVEQWGPPVVSYERYFTRSIELMAQHHFSRPTKRGRRQRDYSRIDRAVI